MNLKTYIVLIIVSVFLLSGCPYESSVPLSSPGKSKIDSRFLGTWEMADEENWGEGVVEIHNFNDHEFMILFKEKDSPGCQAVRAFVTHVKGVSYLNYQEIDTGKQNPWLFVRYHFSEGKMHLNIVEEDLLSEEITSSWKLRSSFKKNQLKEGFLDEEEIVLRRILKIPETN